MVNQLKYQVALSFAGEQRCYVEEVALYLQTLPVAVFYDGFEPVSLWGQSAVEVFNKAFGCQAAYVVMFISKAYVEKAWPRHERRTALNSMIQSDREYVLPVRFDDTPLPGLPEDVIYLDANEYTPAQLSVMIAEKLGIRRLEGKASNVPPPRMASSTGEVAFDYSSYDGRYVIGSSVLEFETKWSKASDTSIYICNDPPSINGVALCRGFESISQIRNAVRLDYSSRVRKPVLDDIVVLRNSKGFYAGIHILDIKDESRGDRADELRFRYAIQSDGSDDFEVFEGI